MIHLLAQTSASSTNPGWLQIIFSGGVIGVAIMLVLIGLSMAALYLVFDQIMSLRRKEIVPPLLADTVRQSLLRGNATEADAACRRTPSVLSYAMLSGLSELDLGWKEVEQAVEEALHEQSARLMRRIEYLSLIGNIAPMVGLLGTVTGMIIAFQQVAVSAGTAGAGDLAEGIYQALVTTVAGLIIAIPSLGAFAICRNRVDELMAEATQRANHALAPIKRMSGTRRQPSATAPKPS